MLNVKDDVYEIEQLFTKPKKIVLYGAGASTRLILQCFYNRGLRERLALIVDKNEALDGTYCDAGSGIKVGVVSLKHFLEQYGRKIKEWFILLIIPYVALQIVDELNGEALLEGVDTYLYSLVTYKKRPAPFTMRSIEKEAIPRRIHYIWIGEGTMPESDLKNIESWRKYCPDYEIVRWDEDSYDFHKNRYTHEAIESRQYMYATDYVRKELLYRYGGIYFDTDVELFRPLDDLLYNEAFIGIEDGGQVNSGSGLGCVAGHVGMRGLMDVYEDEKFVNDDGSLNLKYNTFYETRYLLDKGYELKNRYQVVDGIVCLPKEVFMPESVVGLYDTFTENTVSTHKINPYDKTHVRSILDRIYERNRI